MKYVGVITDKEYVDAYNNMSRVDRAKLMVDNPYEAVQVNWIKHEDDAGKYTNWMKEVVSEAKQRRRTKI